jgi:predicted amidohydrolase
MKNLRIAAIQLCSIENKEENLATCKDLMEQAVRDGAKLIALPENFSFIGKEGEKLTKIEDLENGPSVQFLSEFSLQHEVGIIGGSVPLKGSDNTKVTNAWYLILPGN